MGELLGIMDGRANPLMDPTSGWRQCSVGVVVIVVDM